MTGLTVISAGLELKPKDFKYMPVIAVGCYELRLKIDRQYRVFYVAKFTEAIYVLHAFVKKTQKTPQRDIELGNARYKALIDYRREKKHDRKD